MLRDRSNGTRGQAAPACCTTRNPWHLAMRRVRESVHGECEPSSIFIKAGSERSPLHDVKQHAHGRANPHARESFFSFWTSRTGARGALHKRAAAFHRPNLRAPNLRGPRLCARHVKSASRSIDCRSGGARRDRTDDLLLAKQALSQLSYGPVRGLKSVISNQNVPHL